MIQESSPDCSSTTGQNALDQMQAFFFFCFLSTGGALDQDKKEVHESDFRCDFPFC